jgi:hypothetical protein
MTTLACVRCGIRQRESDFSREERVKPKPTCLSCAEELEEAADSDSQSSRGGGGGAFLVFFSTSTWFLYLSGPWPKQDSATR